MLLQLLGRVLEQVRPSALCAVLWTFLQRLVPKMPCPRVVLLNQFLRLVLTSFNSSFLFTAAFLAIASPTSAAANLVWFVEGGTTSGALCHRSQQSAVKNLLSSGENLICSSSPPPRRVFPVRVEKMEGKGKEGLPPFPEWMDSGRLSVGKLRGKRELEKKRLWGSPQPIARFPTKKGVRFRGWGQDFETEWRGQVT